MTASANCEKGTHAELLFCAEAGARGWQVLIPMGHNSTVDVWIFRPPGRPVSVQVKRAYLDRDGDYGVCLARGSVQRAPYQAGDFDVLAAYLPDLNEFVLWRFSDINERKKIRYSPKRHRQPGNWELLNESSQSLTFYGGVPTYVLPPSAH